MSDQEKFEEQANETGEGIKETWISENWIELLKDFADQYYTEFKLFCSEEYLDYQDNK